MKPYILVPVIILSLGNFALTSFASNQAVQVPAPTIPNEVGTTNASSNAAGIAPALPSAAKAGDTQLPSAPTALPTLPPPPPASPAVKEEAQGSFIDLGDAKLPKISDKDIEKYKELEPSKKIDEPESPYDQQNMQAPKEVSPPTTPPTVKQPAQLNTDQTGTVTPPIISNQPVSAEPPKVAPEAQAIPQGTMPSTVNQSIANIPSSQNNIKQTISNNLKDTKNTLKKKPQIFSAKLYKKQLQNVIDNTKITNLSKEQFVSAEAKMLLLPNDDIVLGKMTRDAEIDFMDGNEYAQLFLQSQEYQNNLEKRLDVERFLANYQQKFAYKHQQAKSNLIDPADSLEKLGDAAFTAITQNSLFALRALMDNYSITQIVDTNNNSLLHKAVMENNYQLTKFLLMRGVNLSLQNFNKQTALQLAIQETNQDIVHLLQKAAY